MTRKEVIIEELHEAGLTMRTAAAMMGLSERTLRNRLADPDSLTIGELRELQGITGMREGVVTFLVMGGRR